MQKEFVEWHQASQGALPPFGALGKALEEAFFAGKASVTNEVVVRVERGMVTEAIAAGPSTRIRVWDDDCDDHFITRDFGVADHPIDRAESLVRQWAASQVRQQPSSGKTINPT